MQHGLLKKMNLDFTLEQNLKILQKQKLDMIKAKSQAVRLDMSKIQEE